MPRHNFPCSVPFLKHHPQFSRSPFAHTHSRSAVLLKRTHLPLQQPLKWDDSTGTEAISTRDDKFSKGRERKLGFALTDLTVLRAREETLIRCYRAIRHHRAVSFSSDAQYLPYSYSPLGTLPRARVITCYWLPLFLVLWQLWLSP